MNDNKSDNRKIIIKVRLNEKEHVTIEKRADEVGRNVARFIREQALYGYIINIDTKPYKDIANQVRGAAVRINQIAERVNRTNNIYQDDVNELKVSIEELSIYVKEYTGSVLEKI